MAKLQKDLYRSLLKCPFYGAIVARPSDGELVVVSKRDYDMYRGQRNESKND